MKVCEALPNGEKLAPPPECASNIVDTQGGRFSVQVATLNINVCKFGLNAVLWSSKFFLKKKNEWMNK